MPKPILVRYSHTMLQEGSSQQSIPFARPALQTNDHTHKCQAKEYLCLRIGDGCSGGKNANDHSCNRN